MQKHMKSYLSLTSNSDAAAVLDDDGELEKKLKEVLGFLEVALFDHKLKVPKNAQENVSLQNTYL